jgi:hypothetical protein
MSNEAQKMPTSGVVGIAGQEPSIKPFCSLKPPGFMVPCRFGQERVGSEVHNRR